MTALEVVLRGDGLVFTVDQDGNFVDNPDVYDPDDDDDGNGRQGAAWEWE